MKALVTIAGHDIPDSSIYSGTVATVVDSGRNTEAVMIGAVIRENVGKVEMKWNFLTIDKWSKICALFDSTRGGSFINTVEFFCPDMGGWVQREMYCSDRKAGVFLRNKDGSIRGLTNCSVNLIEV